MKVLALLPESFRAAEDIQRAVMLIRKRYVGHELHFGAPESMLEHYAPLLAPDVPLRYETGTIEKSYPELVVVIGRGAPPQVENVPHQRIYILRSDPLNLSPRGGFSLYQPAKLDARDNPWIDAHVFHQVGSRTFGFQHFALGPLYIDPEIGPINPFGFRINFDHRSLAERDPNHKVVAIFGGSAAFSCLVMYDEMFASLLEQSLNARGGPLHYTVLNFGMHDHITMQEMVTYLMYVQMVRPDVVISHGGHNDEWYGLQNDRFLLNNYQMVYQRHTEEWSKLIHKTEHVQTPPLFSTTPEIQALNLPQKVIQAYFFRKQQFKTIVEANGGVFLWGHQPLIWSKQKLSELEEEKRLQMENTNPNPLFHRFIRRVKMLHAKTSEELARLKGIRLIDLHQRFEKEPSTTTHFWDHVHCSPAGDQVVAQIYHEAIEGLEREGLLRAVSPGESHREQAQAQA